MNPLRIGTHWIQQHKDVFPQYKAALPVTLFLLVSGTVLGWTSPTLPILEAEDSIIPITETQAKWIGSLMPLGAMIGTFPGGITANVFGRKKALMMVGIMILVSWVILSAAQSATELYFARIIAGFAIGWGMTVQPMYLGEITTPNFRGALGAIGQMHVCAGFLLVYSIGPSVSYVTLCVLSILLTIGFLLTFLCMPESPYYFLLRGNYQGASYVLQKLRCKSEDEVKEELNAMQSECMKSQQSDAKWSDVLMLPGIRKASYMMMSLVTLQQLTGATAVLFYSHSIFQMAETNLSADNCTIVVGVIMLIGSLGAPYLVEKKGRRPLLVITAMVQAISLMLMGTYFFFETKNYDTSRLAWLPLGSIMVFIAANSVGMGPVPWIMVSEVFPPNVRAQGSALSSATSWMATFIVTNLYQPTEDILGASGVFWLFAIACFVGSICLYMFIPETKGKTLQEIQDIFN